MWQPDMLPIGSIIMWAPSAGAFPVGWQLCNGTNGTPDMFGMFVRQFKPGLPVGTTGGTENHSHNFDGDGHVHTVNDVDFTGVGVGTEIWHADADGRQTDEAEVTGVTEASDTIPPFIVLAYIQRIF